MEINDAAENAILSKMILTSIESHLPLTISDYWIGLVDQNGTFIDATWLSSNTTIGNLAAWLPSFAPNSEKLCASAYVNSMADSLEWINSKCSDKLLFICQIGKIEIIKINNFK